MHLGVSLLLSSTFVFCKRRYSSVVQALLVLANHSTRIRPLCLSQKLLLTSSLIPRLKMIIWVIGVLRRTFVGDWPFDNLWRAKEKLTLKVHSYLVLVIIHCHSNVTRSWEDQGGKHKMLHSFARCFFFFNDSSNHWKTVIHVAKSRLLVAQFRLPLLDESHWASRKSLCCRNISLDTPLPFVIQPLH